MKLAKLSGKKLRITLFTEAVFWNFGDKSSQLGFAVIISDENGNFNIRHYVSRHCRRIKRSAMGADLLALVTSFDHEFMVKTLMEELLDIISFVDIQIDSCTTFNRVAKSTKSLKNRLQIDLAALR